MFNGSDASVEIGTCKIPQSSTKYYAQLRTDITVLAAYPYYALKNVAKNVTNLYRYGVIVSSGDSIIDFGTSPYYQIYSGCRIYLSIDGTISDTSVYRDYNNPIICRFYYIDTYGYNYSKNYEYDMNVLDKLLKNW